ncbi:hypothetical protein HLB44_34960 [Aquincola sp. S2]|uniref:Uncharacterized protein n=1 Tax=Pseudaquabacterium terrae TaxID=2732868 RepID=A0ABX2EU76_9BURK|nr:hypothetical protein [Aquabacterium terrae]NRF72198.1 hypothetical protein [Aquabacterium terrae]
MSKKIFNHVVTVHRGDALEKVIPNKAAKVARAHVQPQELALRSSTGVLSKLPRVSLTKASFDTRHLSQASALKAVAAVQPYQNDGQLINSVRNQITTQLRALGWPGQEPQRLVILVGGQPATKTGAKVLVAAMAALQQVLQTVPGAPPPQYFAHERPGDFKKVCGQAMARTAAKLKTLAPGEAEAQLGADLRTPQALGVMLTVAEAAGFSLHGYDDRESRPPVREFGEAAMAHAIGHKLPANGNAAAVVTTPTQNYQGLHEELTKSGVAVIGIACVTPGPLGGGHDDTDVPHRRKRLSYVLAKPEVMNFITSPAMERPDAPGLLGFAHGLGIDVRAHAAGPQTPSVGSAETEAGHSGTVQLEPPPLSRHPQPEDHVASAHDPNVDAVLERQIAARGAERAQLASGKRPLSSADRKQAPYLYGSKTVGMPIKGDLLDLSRRVNVAVERAREQLSLGRANVRAEIEASDHHVMHVHFATRTLWLEEFENEPRGVKAGVQAYSGTGMCDEHRNVGAYEMVPLMKDGETLFLVGHPTFSHAFYLAQGPNGGPLIAGDAWADGPSVQNVHGAFTLNERGEVLGIYDPDRGDGTDSTVALNLRCTIADSDREDAAANYAAGKALGAQLAPRIAASAQGFRDSGLSLEMTSRVNAMSTVDKRFAKAVASALKEAPKPQRHGVDPPPEFAEAHGKVFHTLKVAYWLQEDLDLGRMDAAREAGGILEDAMSLDKTGPQRGQVPKPDNGEGPSRT